MAYNKKRSKHEINQSPNYKLAKEQFKGLNEAFYKNYSRNYYSIKVASLMNILNNQDFYVKELKTTKIKNLEYTFDIEKNETISKYVKTELVMTLFHCLETFIRLFIAHSKIQGCPRLSLAQIDLASFKNAVKNLKNEKYNFMNSKYNDDEIISLTFLGSKTVPKELAEKINLDEKAIIDRFKQYLKYAADFVGKNADYNTFKHGMYLSQQHSGFSFTNGLGEKIGKNGDALVFLTKKRDKLGHLRWFENTKWIDCIQSATLIVFYNHYINSLLTLWQDILVNSSKNGRNIMGPFDLKEILENKSESGLFGDFKEGNKLNDLKKWLDIGDMSVELAYYK